MKVFKSTQILILIFSLFYLGGCATTNLIEGRDFDDSVTSKIIKGKTTANEIIALLGDPYSKLPQDNNTERWLYSYVTVTAHAQAGFFGSMSTTASGYKKNLYFIIDKNGIVDNYTLDEGPFQRSTTTN